MCRCTGYARFHQHCRAPREQVCHGSRCPFRPAAVVASGLFFVCAPAAWRRVLQHTIRAFRRAQAFAPRTPFLSLTSYKRNSFMWFKNLRLFRLAPNWQVDANTLEDALERLAFRPGGATDMTAFGWVPPRAESGLVHAIDGQYLLNLRVEKKLLPATVVNQFARARAQEIEEQQGFRPGRKQMKEIKEQVTDELLPKAFSIYRDTRVWLDTRNRWLVIDAAAAAKSDEVMGALAKVLDPFPVIPLYTELSPASAMTNWLISDEPPANFTIDQDTELRSTNETRAAVRYVRQAVERDEVHKHVQAGKQCTRLALTWADRVSFVLTDGLDVKRVAPLDVLQEGRIPSENEAEQFDSDFMLMCGELSRLLDDLLAALGGEKKA